MYVNGLKGSFSACFLYSYLFPNVKSLHFQTLKFQANLGGFDERLDALREQNQRMVDVTTAQLHSLLKRVVESVCPFSLFFFFYVLICL